MADQLRWKNLAGNPSPPGAFKEPIWNRLSEISFSVKGAQRLSFIAAVTFVSKRFRTGVGKYGLTPNHPFVEDYASCQLAFLPEGFFDMANRGLVRFKRAPDGWCLSENGVVLDDGTEVEADLVFLATDFEGKDKLREVLPKPFRGVLVNKSSMMPLYRGTIHPLIPNMAFVGFVESASNLHTSELRCRWLAGLLDGRFELPSVEAMMGHVDREADAMRRTTRFCRRHCISTYSIHDSDGMCADLGSATHREANWLAELFAPYNQDYKEQ